MYLLDVCSLLNLIDFCILLNCPISESTCRNRHDHLWRPRNISQAVCALYPNQHSQRSFSRQPHQTRRYIIYVWACLPRSLVLWRLETHMISYHKLGDCQWLTFLYHFDIYALYVFSWKSSPMLSRPLGCRAVCGARPRHAINLAPFCFSPARTSSMHNPP